MVTVGSKVGTGNIIGVSMAMCLGGYGAVFWMWVTGLVGSSLAFVESTLDQIYNGWSLCISSLSSSCIKY